MDVPEVLYLRSEIRRLRGHGRVAPLAVVLGTTVGGRLKPFSWKKVHFLVIPPHGMLTMLMATSSEVCISVGIDIWLGSISENR